MKFHYHIFIIASLVSILSACRKEEIKEFALDTDRLEMEAEGGVKNISVTAPGEWTVSSNVPWITVSPANGRGEAVCQVIVDSAVTNTARTGTIRIQDNAIWDSYKEISVSQKGFDYMLGVNSTAVSISNYSDYGNRYFDIDVTTNVNFKVKIPNETSWITYDNYNVNLDRGLRPRKITVRFNWQINSMPLERLSEITFQPVDKDGNEISESLMAKLDKISVTQSAAAPIEENRQGDSTALLGIARVLGASNEWNPSEKMDNWYNVRLWENTGDPDLDGRVRFAQFYMFNTYEGIPYEVQYLTAAEELVFYSNANTFLKNIDTGEYITKLTQLKRLTISAYGLVSLHEDFKNLNNLEYLNLSSNNFQRIPAMINPTNFPKLHSLILSNNQRSLIYDLSNTITENFGGFFDEGGFPERVLEWEKLDTLVLSVNYLEGSVPDMNDYPVKYTEEEVNAVDTLPSVLIGTPKVLPNIKQFSINLNRLTGELPFWLLYHPKLDLWDPYILVFNQEGKDSKGNLAKFTNAPVNMDYYYNLEGYDKKYFAPKSN